MFVMWVKIRIIGGRKKKKSADVGGACPFHLHVAAQESVQAWPIGHSPHRPQDMLNACAMYTGMTCTMLF